MLVLATLVGFYLQRKENFVNEYIDVVYETVSATATVGLSRNLTSQLNIWGKIIIIFTMFFGRVGPISLAVAFNTRKESPNLIKNPTEEISVG